MNKRIAFSSPAIDTSVRYRFADADGVRVFYREAGPADAPVLLLMHGFPSSSHQYRELIAKLSNRYRIIAPDLPGFGFTEVPAERDYVYTFDALAKTIEAFVDVLGLKRYALYVFDYGAPVGLRLAVAHPERVTALVSQNGNAYLDGLGGAWDPIRTYWKEPTQANRDAIRPFISLAGTRWQYEDGVSELDRIAPETYMLDTLLLERPGNVEIQLDLFLDYANNLALYPKFQAWFKASQVPTLVIWGKNDKFFVPAGADAFRRDNTNVAVELLDTGHFALETHSGHIAERIVAVLGNAIV